MFNSLDEVENEAKNCNKCNLCQNRKKNVFSNGTDTYRAVSRNKLGFGCGTGTDDTESRKCLKILENITCVSFSRRKTFGKMCVVKALQIYIIYINFKKPVIYENTN